MVEIQDLPINICQICDRKIDRANTMIHIENSKYGSQKFIICASCKHAKERLGQFEEEGTIYFLIILISFCGYLIGFVESKGVQILIFFLGIYLYGLFILIPIRQRKIMNQFNIFLEDTNIDRNYGIHNFEVSHLPEYLDYLDDKCSYHPMRHAVRKCEKCHRHVCPECNQIFANKTPHISSRLHVCILCKCNIENQLNKRNRNKTLAYLLLTLLSILLFILFRINPFLLFYPGCGFIILFYNFFDLKILRTKLIQKQQILNLALYKANQNYKIQENHCYLHKDRNKAKNCVECGQNICIECISKVLIRSDKYLGAICPLCTNKVEQNYVNKQFKKIKKFTLLIIILYPLNIFFYFNTDPNNFQNLIANNFVFLLLWFIMDLIIAVHFMERVWSVDEEILLDNL